VDHTIRPKDGHRPPSATEEGEKARFAYTGQAEQGGTSAPHQPLYLSIGDIDWLDLKTEGSSRCFDPALEPLSTVSYQTEWRGWDLYCPRH
jgi:hypothetical protein